MVARHYRLISHIDLGVRFDQSLFCLAVEEKISSKCEVGRDIMVSLEVAVKPTISRTAES